MEVTLRITDPSELSKFGAFLCGFGPSSAANTTPVSAEVKPKPKTAEPVKTAPVAKAPVTATAAPAEPEPASAPVAAAEDKPIFTVEHLRAVTGAKAKENDGEKRQAIKTLLAEFGASSVSTLAPEHYAAYLAKVEAL